MKHFGLLGVLFACAVSAQGIVPPSSGGSVVEPLTLSQKLTSNVSSGSPAISLLQGARLTFDGATGAKYLSSDGTTLTATGLAFSASSFTATAASTANAFIANQGAFYCLNNTCTQTLSYDGTSIKLANYWSCASATGNCTFSFPATFSSTISSSSLSLSVSNTATFSVPTTDSSGSPGAATINKISGKAAVAAAAASVVITDSTVAATDRVIITPLSLDTTCINWKAVPASGSFTVTTNANCTAAWSFSFLVIK